MRKRSALTLIALVLGLAGLVLGGIFISRLPRTLTLAAGPAGLETHRYAEAVARASLEGRGRIRYKIVTTSGAAESAKLLEDGKVNLAIIRSDVDLPANGQTIIVNAKRLALVIAPQLKRGGIQKLGDLRGKRIAVVRLTDPNLPLVRRMLAVADIAEGAMTLIECDLADLPDLLATGKADAAIAVMVTSAPAVAETIPQIAKRVPGGIRFIPIAEAEAMANRIIGVETAELPAGSFGSGRPQEEVATIAISYRTMARENMPNELAGLVAQSLYNLRTRLSRQVPIAFSSEPPDAKTGARLPVHPGATEFFDGESKSFLERYGELLLTILWGGTLVGSAASGLMAWIYRSSHQDGGKLLSEIASLTGDARAAAGAGMAGIDARVDAIVAELAQLRSKGRITEQDIEGATLAIEHYRNVADIARTKAA
jgi:TRAP transporter TAXI family solute receptor